MLVMAVKERHFISVQSRGLLALPAKVRKRYKLDEPGTQVELIERDDGVLEIRPYRAVPADQAWFWTPEWQAGEKEATEDIDAERTERFDEGEDLVDALRSR
jgi:bifunctional DNA-binding transcriptional regulator/antitoxin component of YhaV-PrlF toxin-antitoxin module